MWLYKVLYYLDMGYEVTVLIIRSLLLYPLSYRGRRPGLYSKGENHETQVWDYPMMRCIIQSSIACRQEVRLEILYRW